MEKKVIQLNLKGQPTKQSLSIKKMILSKEERTLFLHKKLVSTYYFVYLMSTMYGWMEMKLKLDDCEGNFLYLLSVSLILWSVMNNADLWSVVWFNFFFFGINRTLFEALCFRTPYSIWKTDVSK